MALRAENNTVRLAVLQIALDGQPFTVFDVERRTGMKLESIRTQVQRLRSGDYIVNVPPEVARYAQITGAETTSVVAESRPDSVEASEAESPGGTRRGAPAARYTLTDDPDKVQELRESIASFYAQMPIRRSQEPTSQHFLNAKTALDELSDRKTEEKRESMLRRVEVELEVCNLMEGDEDAPAEARAAIAFEYARLDFERGNFQKAETAFAELAALATQHPGWRSINIARALGLEVACKIHTTPPERGRAKIRDFVAGLPARLAPATKEILRAVTKFIPTKGLVQAGSAGAAGPQSRPEEFQKHIGRELEPATAAL